MQSIFLEINKKKYTKQQEITHVRVKPTIFAIEKWKKQQKQRGQTKTNKKNTYKTSMATGKNIM